LLSSRNEKDPSRPNKATANVNATGWRSPEQAEAVEFELIDALEREALNLAQYRTGRKVPKESEEGKYSVFLVLKDIS
jgi:hypothetical protein